MNSLVTPDGDILARLKLETRAEHIAIESALGLADEWLTIASYRRILERFYGFYRPVEDRLRALGGWEDWGLDLEERRKAPLLEADLRSLGVAGPARLPVCGDLPPLHDLAACFGCLYVLEGASLGGQVISRQILRELAVTPSAGGRFFHGYGDRTGRMWLEFRTALSGFAATAERRDHVVAAAVSTFRTLRLWCEGADDSCPRSDR